MAARRLGRLPAKALAKRARELRELEGRYGAAWPAAKDC
jgi:hypothetical protein